MHNNPGRSVQTPPVFECRLYQLMLKYLDCFHRRVLFWIRQFDPVLMDNVLQHETY